MKLYYKLLNITRLTIQKIMAQISIADYQKTGKARFS